ncbi:MAG: HAD family hydrolase [Kiritimatiellae bacterium]|nr:HAD family hydrolase [Kiritimatiellia bacterium]
MMHSSTIPEGRRIRAALIYDLDGTLLDTIGDMADAMNAALEARGFPVRSEEECKKLVGEGPEVFGHGALPEDARTPENVAAIIEAYRAGYALNWSRRTCPYSGIPDMLATVHRMGIPQAILSNKRDEVVKEITAHFLPGVPFVAVCGARREYAMKPDAAAALDLAALMECAPSRVFFVGDTKTDMQTARAAGMRAVGVCWGFRTAEELLAHGAHHLLNEPGELMACLLRHTAP